MLFNNGKYESWDTQESSLPASEEKVTATSIGAPTKFYGRYSDAMLMYAPAHTVAEYLEAHKLWFSRCAEPMQVETLSENAYVVIIGRFGSFGYEVEPKLGLELLPADEGVYRIRTVPVPDYDHPGYDVDYLACLRLVESLDTNHSVSEVTHVQWELDLTVNLHFPKFIHRLPKSLIQSTGDNLLNQIVRKVSRRLTRKVQQDFHQSLNIPLNESIVRDY